MGGGRVTARLAMASNLYLERLPFYGSFDRGPQEFCDRPEYGYRNRVAELFVGGSVRHGNFKSFVRVFAQPARLLKTHQTRALKWRKSAGCIFLGIKLSIRIYFSFCEIVVRQSVVVSKHYNKKLKRNEIRRVFLRHGNKFVRRIFYRGNWRLGGRYHGGWWQQIPSKLRNQILIDDQYTVEVDFSGFHIALAYGVAGHQPPDDPYALPVSIGGLSPEQQRKDVKLIALTAINAKDRKATFSAFRDQRNKDQRALPRSQKIKYTDALLEQLLDNFLKANYPISHYLCADKGVELMALDGQITTEIIKHFTDRGVPILTVHDSYIVESAYEQELMDVMQSVTRKIVGNQKFKMKQEELSQNLIRSFVNQDKQINAMDGYRTITASIIRTPGYLLRYKVFQKYLEDYPLT